MRGFARWMLKLDRRAIFAQIALAVLLPLLNPIGLPIRVSPDVQRVYDYLDSLPSGSVFFLSMDFDPASKPELYPMALAILRHAFRKDLKVIGMTLWVTGTGLAEQAFSSMAVEMGKERGKDYVFLGYKPGSVNVIIGLGQDLFTTFPTDYYGTRTAELPMLQGIRSLKDVGYMVDLAAGSPGIEAWYVYGKEKHGFELGGGATAVIAPGLYPLLQTGQVNGLIGGLRGAAEYEKLVEIKGLATAGMDAQSFAHLLIMAFIVIANVTYVYDRWSVRRI